MENCDKYFPGTIARRILLFGTSVVNHLLFYVKENQISPTYSSLNFFIFLSLQFSNIKKKYFSFLSDCESHTKLKLGLHMNSRLMYHVYLKRLLVFIYSFSFLADSQTLNFWSHFSVRPTKLKLDTHMGKGLMWCTPNTSSQNIHAPLFFCLSNWQRLKTCIYKIVSTYL